MDLDERARAAFGQSLGSEEWAVRANELAWRARRSRLWAFQSKESGHPGPSHHEQDADDYDSQHDDWVRRMPEIIEGINAGWNTVNFSYKDSERDEVYISLNGRMTRGKK